jgi:hypothetical protein
MIDSDITLQFGKFIDLDHDRVNMAMPAWQSLPAYFKSTNYRNPTDPLKAPLQYAFKSDKHFFDMLVEQDLMTKFQTAMSDYRAGRAEMLDIYPAEKNLVQGDDGDSIFFVDVGGGRGHEIDKVLERFPQEKRRVVLQDLPHVVKEVEGATNKEVMAYDFFTPQPVKGEYAGLSSQADHTHLICDCRSPLLPLPHDPARLAG